MENVKEEVRIIDDMEQLRFALDNVPSYVYIKDRDSRYLYANKHTLQLFGCSAEALIGCGDSCFFPTDAVKRLREVDLGVLSGESSEEEIVVDGPDGKRVYHEVKTPIYDRENQHTVVALLGISTDITEQKRMEGEVRKLAFTDPLTGLANRRKLFECIEKAQAYSIRQGTYGAIIYIDLDRFKEANDTYGHETGDQLLTAVADRLRTVVNPADTVARIGGDEFVVLVQDAGPKHCLAVDYISEFVLTLASTLSEVYRLNGVLIRITASIGTQLFQGNDQVISQIISRADADMYRKKG